MFNLFFWLNVKYFFNNFKKFNFFFFKNNINWSVLNKNNYLFVFNHNYNLKLSLNKFFFFFNNFLFHFSNYSNFKLHKYKNNLLNKQYFFNRNFKKFKLFNLKKNNFYLISNNLSLFTFLNFRNSFFFKTNILNLKFKLYFYNIINLLFVEFFNYKIYNFNLTKINFNFLNIFYKYEEPCLEISDDENFVYETDDELILKNEENDIDREFKNDLYVYIDEIIQELKDNIETNFLTTNFIYDFSNIYNLYYFNSDLNNPSLVFFNTEDYFINKKYDKFLNNIFNKNLKFYRYLHYVFDIKYNKFIKKDIKMLLDKNNKFNLFFSKNNKDLINKLIFFKLPKRYKSFKFFNKYNYSSYFSLYKHILKELINFNDNFFYRYIFSFNINFYSFISISYFNLINNFNFIDEVLFNDKNYQFFIDSNMKNTLKSLQINFSNKDYIFNNHFPVLLNPELVSILFFNNKSKFNFINFSKFYNLYFTSFFENILKKSVFFKVDTNFFKKYTNLNQVEKIINEYRNFNNKFSKFFHVTEMIEIIWYSFEFKDLNILSNWLTKMLGFINLKNHKKFLNLFQSLILDYSIIYFDFLKIKGFFFKIKGKIGLSGNAKKKQIKFRIGKIYLSDKFTKVICEKNISKTDYGVLGFTMVLAY
jgi:hypothetical protein